MRLPRYTVYDFQMMFSFLFQISRECIGIPITAVFDPKRKENQTQLPASPSNAAASNCDVLANELEPCVPCMSAPSFSISQMDDPWKFLFDPVTPSADRSRRTTGASQAGPSLLSPPPVPLAPRAPRDALKMTQSKYSHKGTFRPQAAETLKVDTIEARLSGLIPPFDSRSTSAHQPSTTTFNIPNCVPWPQIQWSRECLASSPNGPDATVRGSTNKTSKKAQMWLHREPVTDTIMVVPRSSTLSTLSPRSSISRSNSDSSRASLANSAFFTSDSPLDNMPFQTSLELEQHQSKPNRYHLCREDVYLLGYLLVSLK